VSPPIVWLELGVLLAIHDAQLAEHGGASGLRDRGLLESALARPRNLAAYGKPDLAALAASYGHGLLRNHAFVDGNKRTALMAVELFLERNGYGLTAGDEECVLAILEVAQDRWSENQLAAWLRDRLVRSGRSP
jgi:death-on-curing protein